MVVWTTTVVGVGQKGMVVVGGNAALSRFLQKQTQHSHATSPICFSSVLHLSCLFVFTTSTSSCLLSCSQPNPSWFTASISYIHFNFQYIPDRNFISLFNSYNLEFTLRRDSPKKRNTSSTTTSFACSRIQCPTSSMRTSFIPLANS